MVNRRGYLAIILIVSLFLTACMNRSNDKSTKIEQKERAPKALVKVADGIDELLSSVDKIVELEELSETEFKAQTEAGKKDEEKSKEESNKSSEEEKNQEQGQEQAKEQEGQKKKEDKEITKDEILFMKWKEVDQKLEQIHKDWNSYEVESRQKGVNSEKANEFKKHLNAFTIAVENRKVEEIENMGSRAINSLAVFFDLYKDEIRGDLSRIKYSIHQAFIEGEKGNKNAAKNLLTKTEDYTSRIRQKLENHDEKIKDLDRLSLAAADMKMALDDSNKKLLKIKRDIALDNIKSLQE